MIRRRLALTAAALTAVSPELFAQNLAASRRMALLVGNSHYKSSPLKTPPDDVAVFGATLESANFAVQRELNLTGQQFQKVVEEFARRVAAAQALGLVYLSGHGMTVRGSIRFLGVSDEGAASAEAAFRQSTALGWVLSTMALRRKSANSQAPILLLADISSTSPFPEAPGSRPVTSQALTAPLEGTPRSLVMLASLPGTEAGDDEKGEYGAMTRQLIWAFGTDGLSLADMDREIRRSVRTSSKIGQIPWSTMDSDIEGLMFRAAVPKDDPKVRGRSARGG